METQGNTKTPVMGCITVCADSVRSGNMVTEGIGMSDSIRACEERIKDLTEQINAVNDRLAELKEQMLAVQQSLESTFILAFGKKKELRAELDVLTGREKTLLEQRRVLQDKLSDARIDKVMAEEAAAQAIIEAQKRAEAELARIIAEEQARNKDFEIQDGVLIKYTGDDTDVTIPDGVTSIGEKAFESSKVRNVVIPHGVTSIGNSAFAYCWKLESIKLPDTLTEIGEHAFTCTGVKDIVIPNMVTRIGSFAFNTCIYLEHIKLPPSLTAISLSLFSSCRQLKRIVIPESIKEIGTFAFHDCPVLESFVIPEGVKTIKYHTFNACSNLVHIGIPASVTEIDKEAFEGCKKLVATVKPGSYAEKFCRQGRIRYFYSDGSAPAAPPPHAEAKPASSTLPATNAAAKTPATSAATMKAKEPTPTRAAQLEQTGVFDLSQVPESIRPQLSRLLNNLLSAYPDKVVSGLSRDHGHWAETLTKLYKELGYPSGQALLEAYGFVVEKSVGGRPSKDHTAVIEELRKLYPQPFVGTVSALSKAHPELASRIKTLTNSAQILFGMSLSDYLKQEGIITTNQPKAQKKETVPAVQQAPEKSLKEKADEVIAELKKRYPNIMTAPKTITQLKEDNPDISFDTLSSRVRTAYKMPLKEFLVSMELLKGNVSTKEKTSGENGRVYWEEAFTRTILTRGLEYYHTGKVHLTESSHEKYAATVSGSEEYEVSIQLAQGIVTKMQCNCPYAGDGLRCKHMAAVLYAVTKGQELFCAKEVITEVSRSNQPVQSMPAPVLASEPTERLDELFDVVQVESPKKKRNLSDASEAAFKRYEFAFKAGIWFRGPSAVIKKILWQYRDVCQPEPIEACGKGIAQVYVLFSLSNQVRVFDMMRQYSVLRVTCFAGIRYPYGKTLKEKLSIYRDEVRKYPNCAQLKEALIGVINFECELQGAFPDPALYREMANLTEDIIALGGGKHGLSYHRHQLVYYSEKLKNPVRAAEIAETAPEMEACKEVLLPSSLSGREQIDARKNLIFKCTDLLINTIYALYGENASDLTEDEWEALRSTENVVATMYGHDFSNHFVLARNLYSAVHGALKRGNQAEAINRLQQVAEKLSALETETAPRNPLVLEAQFDDLCMALHVAFSIKMESMLIIERMLKDFGPENVPALRRENEQFDIICATLDRLMDSDGGQVKKDCWAAYHKIRNIVKEE